MNSISQELQQEILNYGHNLYVSQRGLFVSALNYPNWKKFLFLLLTDRDKNFSKATSLKNLLEKIRFAHSEQESSKNDFAAFAEFLQALIFVPIIGLFLSPYIVEMVQRKITWNSTETTLLFEAMVLGCLVEE